MSDTPPAIDTELGKAKRLKAKGRRVKVTCKAGGYEQRTCKIKLETRSHGKRRTVARGTGTIAPGAGQTQLKLKLTGKGRRLVKDAPRKGLRVKATVSASERYTDRSGEGKRRLRVR